MERYWARAYLAMDGGPEVIYSKGTMIDREPVVGEGFFILEQLRTATLNRVEPVGDALILHFDLDSPEDYERLLAQNWSTEKPNPQPVAA